MDTAADSIDIAKLRERLGDSLAEFATRLGLKSKGQASEIERGLVTPTVKVALEIERLSNGDISAASLNPDVALIEAHVAERDQGEAA